MIASAAYAIAVDAAARAAAERQATLARLVAAIDSQQTIHATETLARAVRSARKQRKMTQRQLATRAGLGVRMVNELERGRRPHISLTAVLTIARQVGLELTVRHRVTP